MTAPPRLRRTLGGTFLGRWLVVAGSTGVRTNVFDLGDRLEVEERDHWLINRRRIPLRDVVLMTRREVRRIGAVIGCLVIAGLLAIPVVILARTTSERFAPTIIFLIFSAPFLVFAVLFALPVTEIQVQSRRVTACLRLGYFNRARTARLWSELTTRVRSAQPAPAVPAESAVAADQPAAAPAGDAASATP